MSPDDAPPGGAVPRFEQPAPRPDWLAQLREETIEPDLPIVDAHHHFSQHWGGYFGNDLVADIAGGHRVEATVYIQCRNGYLPELGADLAPVGETMSAIRIANDAQHLRPETKLCAGIVGFADFTLGEEVDRVLAAHVAAGEGRFRGIRRAAARHDSFRYGVLEPPPAGVYLDEGFRRGFARLEKFDLSFDALCYHTQLPEVTSLACAFPDTPLVLDHIGMPIGIGPFRERRAEVFDDWRRNMGALAKCPNAFVKVGGMGMTVFGFDFHRGERPPSSLDLAAAWRPYVETCIELFGVNRCMFESNFPVDKSDCSYHALWNAFKRICAGMSAAEKLALFSGTAASVYRLRGD